MEGIYDKSKILVNEFENNETAEVIMITMNDGRKIKKVKHRLISVSLFPSFVIVTPKYLNVSTTSRGSSLINIIMATTTSVLVR